MGNASAIVFSGIAPHPPIMVPEVGREAVAPVRKSIDAMADFTRRVIESGAETVVLVSPHAPLDARAFVAYHSRELHGDFGDFRAPGTQSDFANELLLETISKTAREDEYEVLKLKNRDLIMARPYHSTSSIVTAGADAWWRSYSFLANEIICALAPAFERQPMRLTTRRVSGEWRPAIVFSRPAREATTRLRTVSMKSGRRPT